MWLVSWLSMATVARLVLLLMLYTPLALSHSTAHVCPSTSASYAQEQQRGHEIMASSAEFNVITKTIVLNQGTEDEARANIRQYFQDTFDLDSSLFSHITPSALWSRADPLRHPVLWYAAHTASFYINKLRVSQALNQPLSAHFESLFAVGVDEMSWDDKLADRNDWPPPRDIFAYREEVRAMVLDIIDSQPLPLPIEWNSLFYAVLMGIEHERIHIETSSVLIRQLPIESVRPNNDSEPVTPWDNICKAGKFSASPPVHTEDDRPLNELVAVAGKYVSYGRQIDDFSGELAVFGWDNEFGEMSIAVPDFAASKYLVSNEEYFEFVLDGGYANNEWWTREGWEWVRSTDTSQPKFWVVRDNEYFLRNMLIEVPMPWDWPAITNQLEAEAFTRWKSSKLNATIRLLTEDEWHVLRQLGEYGSLEQPNWQLAPGNINLEFYASESPVDMFAWGNTSFFDIIGNVWQHTLTPSYPFDGFQVHAIYDDFSAPCFGADHNLIKGGSWVSTGNEAIARSRYQFRRHFFQHAGIRYVESTRDLQYLSHLAERNPYDDDEQIARMTHSHYAMSVDAALFGVENWPRRVAQLAINAMDSLDVRFEKALDVGCAAGRSAFELATRFSSVSAVDFTVRLLGVGYRMQENGAVEWVMKEQGEKERAHRTEAKDLGLDSATLQRVSFVQADAQNLPPPNGGQLADDYDLVLAANLLSKLSNPRLFLEGISMYCREGALLVVCDAYDWDTEHTPRANWIGGRKDEESAEEAVKALLVESGHWRWSEEKEVEQVVRLSKRTFTHTQAHCMLLRRV